MNSGRGGDRPEPSALSAETAPSRLAWTVAVALLASWLLISLRFPPGRDQGVFLWIGEVVRDGGAPYRDAWETKGPLVFALSGLIRGAFGPTTWGIRLFDGLVVIGTLATVVWLLRAAGARAAASWSAVVMAVTYTRLGWWDSAQPETWATACMALGLVLVCTDGASARPVVARLVAAGLFTGCAALVKPFFALFWIAPAYVIWHRFGSRRLSAVVLFTAGSIAAGLLSLAWMASYGSGVIEAFIQTHLRFNASVYASSGGMPWPERITRVLVVLGSTPIMPALLLALPALYGMRHRSSWLEHPLMDVTGHGPRIQPVTRRMLAKGAAIWLALALLWVLVQGKLWLYQWTPAFPPLAILAGLGTESIWRGATSQSFPGKVPSRVAVLLVGAYLLVGARAPAMWIAAWMRDTIFVPDAGVWYAHFGPYDLENGELPAIARHLRDTIPPEETVLVWGMEPVIYALSGRLPPTRYGVSIPLVLGTDTPVRRSAQEQFAVDLASRRPAAIVVLDNDRNQLLPRDSRELLTEVPELEQLLVRSYVAGKRFPNARVYRRR